MNTGSRLITVNDTYVGLTDNPAQADRAEALAYAKARYCKPGADRNDCGLGYANGKSDASTGLPRAIAGKSSAYQSGYRVAKAKPQTNLPFISGVL